MLPKDSTVPVVALVALWLMGAPVVLPPCVIEGGYAQVWERVDCGGLADVDNESSFPMQLFNGNLYVGTWNATGAEIWMTTSQTGDKWYQVADSGFGNPENTSLTSMAVFNDQLYVGVLRRNGGELWFTGDGLAWEQAATPGFSGDYGGVRVMGDFAPSGSELCLFAGTDNETGTEVLMSCDGLEWVPLGTAGFGDVNNTSAYSMEVYESHLYLGTRNQRSGTQIWRTRGGVTWSQVNTDGFGYGSNWAAYSMCTFKGYLYVGTVNQLTGTQVWRTNDGITWFQSNLDGFGNPENTCAYAMTVFNDHLFVGTGNEVARVWRTADGVVWEQDSVDGFGDSGNKRVHSLLTYGNYLYAGTGNALGAQLWRYREYGGASQPCLLETVLKEDTGTLDALRGLRDAIIAEDSGGALHVRSYYQYSSEMVSLYNRYPGIKRETMSVIKAVLPEVLLVLGGKKQLNDSALLSRVSALLDLYYQFGSPGLRETIQHTAAYLKTTFLSDSLRFGGAHVTKID